MKIVLDTEWYYLLLCIALGVVYAVVLYLWKGRREGLNVRSSRLAVVLAAVRFATVTVIAFLLLSPMVKSERHNREKPVVALLEDQSQSLFMTADSARMRTSLAPTLDSLAKALQTDYEVVRMPFGGASTDIAAALSEANERYAGRNLGAVVLVSDGIYNQGSNPTTVQLSAPVYCVALGDTAVRRDAAVAAVRVNRTAYLGNRFPMEITVRATRMAGQSRTLSVEHGDHTLLSRKIAIDSPDLLVTEQLTLDANEAGLQTYTIRLDPTEGEAIASNNRRTVTVDVVDGRQKVAIVAAAPHPDLAAIAAAIGSNAAYEAKILKIGEISNLSQLKSEGYNLVVFHNLPSTQHDLRGLPDDLPALFVIGSQTDLPRFNALHAGLEIVTKLTKTTEAQAVVNDAFSLFTLGNGEGAAAEQWPPLTAPFGDYRTGAATQTLFSARLGQVTTHQPLIAFVSQGAARRGFVAGEGLWRWRLADYRLNGSHEAFNSLISKMIGFTALQARRDQFNIDVRPLYRTDEDVVVEAELYNDLYEPINTPDVTLTLRGEREGEYAMNRTATGYQLNLGPLPEGRYSYEGVTTYDGRRLSAHGLFAVEHLSLEELSLTADHSLLTTIASQSGGQMLPLAEVASLPTLLKERSDLKPIVYTQRRHTELVGLPWLLVALVLLMGTEWVARKRNGEV
ncbi:MAG: hypothetical protein IJ789_01465 [Bacteroidales bacterium]|nr:hypothetical protein [Bacteroidales bacterium]